MGAAPKMNRSAKGGARSSLHYGGEGVLIHPPHQGVCGRHGTEEQCVTSGGLAESPGGNRRKRTYKHKRKGEQGSVSSRTAAKYHKRGENRVTASAVTRMGRGRQPAKMVGKRRRSRMSKGGKVEQFRE
jgi:hypothetical protein